MTADAVPSLSQALTKFAAAKKNGRGVKLDHRELSRFVAWCGRERNVIDLTPSEVADYAEYVGLGGMESAQRLNPVKAFLGFWKDEGWIQNGLAAHLRIPRGRRGSTKRVGSAYREERGSQLSQEGYDKLVAQLDVLKEDRVNVVEDIRQAMEDKDFRENAPLEAAKERQALTESRIRELEAAITNAQILARKASRPSQRGGGRGKGYVAVRRHRKESDVHAGRCQGGRCFSRQDLHCIASGPGFVGPVRGRRSDCQRPEGHYALLNQGDKYLIRVPMNGVRIEDWF